MAANVFLRQYALPFGLLIDDWGEYFNFLEAAQGKDAPLLAYQVLDILIVLVADVFEELCIGEQPEGQFDRPRFGISFGVVHGDLEIHVAEIPAPEAFRYAQRLRAGKSEIVHPSAIVEFGGGLRGV